MLKSGPQDLRLIARQGMPIRYHLYPEYWVDSRIDILALPHSGGKLPDDARIQYQVVNEALVA